MANSASNAWVVASYPGFEMTQPVWNVRVRNTSASDVNYLAWVYCLV